MIRALADAISNIKFGCITNARTVTIKYSKHTYELCKILYDNGVIQGYSSMQTISNQLGIKNSVIRVEFKFRADTAFVKGIRRISRPGGRVYWNINALKRRIAHNNNVVILSTSRGMMTLKDAVLNNIGGEAICAVYMRGA
jgi:small subunit ribosomal protein S8